MKRIILALFLLLSSILTAEIQVDEGINEFRIYEKGTPRDLYFSVEKDKVFIGNNYNSTEVFLKGDFTLGKDDTGYDFRLYGATSGKYLLWDESADKFYIVGDFDVDGTTTVDAFTAGETATFSDDVAMDSTLTVQRS